MNKILEIRNLYKNYGRKGYETPVLQDISMDIFEGDFIAIMGPKFQNITFYHKINKFCFICFHFS